MALRQLKVCIECHACSKKDPDVVRCSCGGELVLESLIHPTFRICRHCAGKGKLRVSAKVRLKPKASLVSEILEVVDPTEATS